MPNRKNRKIGLMAIASLFGLTLSSHTAMALPFQITVENLSNNVLTPVPFITHSSGFDLFDENSAASPAVEALAEGGDISGVIALADAAKISNEVLDFAVAANGGPITPGQTASVTVNADASHGWLSFMSMLAISNDAFIGGTTDDGAIKLFDSGSPVYGTYYLSPAQVWDAGTEANDELAGNVPALMGMGSVDEMGLIAPNHPGILGIGDIEVAHNWTGLNSVASITVASAPVPEPTTMLLFGAGLAGLVGFRTLKRNRSRSNQ